MSNPFSMQGKVALVTGGASGIGAAIVKTLAEAGAKVAITDIDEVTGAALVVELSKKGHQVCFFKHDVRSQEQWQDTVTGTIDKFGSFDVLINNAGVIGGKLMEETTLEEFKFEQAVNIDGTFLGLQQACKVMKPQGQVGKGGSIINLSSIAGLIGSICHTTYGATKGAVKMMSKHCAVEFATLGYNIRVNSVIPGVIDTPMGASVFKSFSDVVGGDEAAIAAIMGLTPLKRTGTPEDVANVVLFLACDASSYVTGAEYAVDGGFTAQ